LETLRISAGALAGRNVIARAGAMANLALGYFQARQHLTARRPSAVVGFGGYASAPTVTAAANLHIPAIVHEQNAILGRANRLLAARVQRVCTSFDLAQPAPDGAYVVRTGMPVRPTIAAVRDIPYVAPAQTGPFRILVLGGSQGARVFSDVIPAALAKLPRSMSRRIEITQQCRPEDLERVAAAYQPLGIKHTLSHFFDNVPELLANAHVLIARSGASTVGEVTVAGRPSLLIPYPFAADDHQTANAAALAAKGGAWLMPQLELTPDTLAVRLTEFLTAPTGLAEAAEAARAFAIPDAAARLAQVVTALIRGENGAHHSTPARGAA
jgi:UDP-N-acetylglucosamine--N-acetylmuramyl-(pentapeptide) pyrophosphoryl-undecaprenol N-acetylglucosamine transferase